jgi:hypothetical protein
MIAVSRLLRQVARDSPIAFQNYQGQRPQCSLHFLRVRAHLAMSVVLLATIGLRGQLRNGIQYHPTAHHLGGGVIFELSLTAKLLNTLRLM